MNYFVRKLGKAALKTALGWIDDDILPVADIALAAFWLIILIAFIGALVAYVPSLLLNGHLASSVGTFLAYQCLAGSTCDFDALMSGLALGLYLLTATSAMVMLLVFRWIDWEVARRELAAEETEEDDGHQVQQEPVKVNGRKPLPL